MIVIEINSVCYGSTGMIGREIGEVGSKYGHVFYFAYPNGRHMKKEHKDKKFIPIGGKLSQDMHLFFGRLFGLNGLLSVFSTLIFIHKLKKIKPNIIHLHNIHKNYLNIPLFFKYLKNENVKVVWTLHDCWSFTGRCPHYIVVGCNKWKTGCNTCPYPRNLYPQSYIDTSRLQWKIKKKYFGQLKNLILVAPSFWLKEQISQSYLNDKTSMVINNGIDITKFKNVDSSIRDSILDKKKTYIVLGVSMDWNYRKGLDTFIKIADTLTDEYQVVLIGVSDNVRKSLPDKIISLSRIGTAEELASYYAAADVFVNPTREDTFPTVNIEALACGTPVVTRNVGGCAEIIDSSCGIAITGDYREFVHAIIKICSTEKMDRENCIHRAKQFLNTDRFKNYIELFEKLQLEKEQL